jgi:para-aminobenzoate synthetase component 1
MSGRRGRGPGPLELHEPEGALELLEEYLRGHGFFRPGSERLVADLYLGYGLAGPLRRVAAPSPPEPCPLPLVACAVRTEEYVVENGNSRSFDVGAWQATWVRCEYARAVERVRAAIARGDVYQVNLVQHLSAPFAGDPRALAARLKPLRPHNPTPFVGSGWAVVSASPELFLARRGRRVWTMPIKGTRPLGDVDDLAGSAKDAAEHVMIVDLERNDLSRVCEPGSVRWPELMAPRTLAGVEHLVSTVEGTLRPGVGLAELLAATFPGGSVTGAPKIAAIDLIASLEPVGRGASMGALGTVRGNGDLDLALTIRTFALAAGRIHLWVGGGVVWDSEPDEEVDESWTKARPLLAAIGSPLPAGADRAGAVTG